jgi:predicted N-acetyltransferase YhbS
MNLILRNENDTDFREVEELTRESFWNLYFPGCDEHYLVHKMRSHHDFVKELDFVAVSEGRIIGSILYTRSQVVDETGRALETLTFGPLCVHPSFQRKGIGKALISHTSKLAIEMGYPAIIIYGDPHNYCVNGFKSCKDFNLTNKDGKHPYAMMVLELKEGVFANHKWTLQESDVYILKPEEVEEFDKSFSPKEKSFQHSQVEFSMAVRAIIE